MMRKVKSAVSSMPAVPRSAYSRLMRGRVAWFIRAGLVIAALLMIEGGIATDLGGIALAAVLFFVQKLFHPRPDATIPVRGAD